MTDSKIADSDFFWKMIKVLKRLNVDKESTDMRAYMFLQFTDGSQWIHYLAMQSGLTFNQRDFLDQIHRLQLTV